MHARLAADKANNFLSVQELPSPAWSTLSMLCGEAASCGKAASPLSSTLVLWMSRIRTISDRKRCETVTVPVCQNGFNWSVSHCHPLHKQHSDWHQGQINNRNKPLCYNSGCAMQNAKSCSRKRIPLQQLFYCEVTAPVQNPQTKIKGGEEVPTKAKKCISCKDWNFRFP